MNEINAKQFRNVFEKWKNELRKEWKGNEIVYGKCLV